MIYRCILALLHVLTPHCSSSPEGNPHIEIRTKIGTIEVELYPEKAPQTVRAILSYIDVGLYKDGSFYRVLNMNNQPSDAW